MFLYFLRLAITSELQDSNELNVLDSSLRLQFSNKKPNNLNELCKSVIQIFKNFGSLHFSITMQLLYTQMLFI